MLKNLTAIFCLIVLNASAFGQSSTKSPEFVTEKKGFAGGDAGERKELVPGIAFHWCPAGKFTMGSPETEPKRGTEEGQVEVTLTQGFWLGETEVTQRQWRKVMETTPWKGKQAAEDDDNFPASYISHNDAMKFLEKLTKEEQTAGRLPLGWAYSLPTEAQWEYACRAGTRSKYSFGDSEIELLDYAWFRKNTGMTPEDSGRKKANTWGLKDMHGNLWEWCQDWGEWSPQGGIDPVGSPTGTFRVRRGGSWYSIPESCRSAMRHVAPPDLRHMEIGFRIAAIQVR